MNFKAGESRTTSLSKVFSIVPSTQTFDGNLHSHCSQKSPNSAKSKQHQLQTAGLLVASQTSIIDKLILKQNDWPKKRWIAQWLSENCDDPLCAAPKSMLHKDGSSPAVVAKDCGRRDAGGNGASPLDYCSDRRHLQPMPQIALAGNEVKQIGPSAIDPSLVVNLVPQGRFAPQSGSAEGSIAADSNLDSSILMSKDNPNKNKLSSQQQQPQSLQQQHQQQHQPIQPPQQQQVDKYSSKTNHNSSNNSQTAVITNSSNEHVPKKCASKLGKLGKRTPKHRAEGGPSNTSNTNLKRGDSKESKKSLHTKKDLERMRSLPRSGSIAKQRTPIKQTQGKGGHGSKATQTTSRTAANRAHPHSTHSHQHQRQSEQPKQIGKSFKSKSKGRQVNQQS